MEKSINGPAPEAVVKADIRAFVVISECNLQLQRTKPTFNCIWGLIYLGHVTMVHCCTSGGGSVYSIYLSGDGRAVKSRAGGAVNQTDSAFSISTVLQSAAIKFTSGSSNVCSPSLNVYGAQARQCRPVVAVEIRTVIVLQNIVLELERLCFDNRRMTGW